MNPWIIVGIMSLIFSAYWFRHEWKQGWPTPIWPAFASLTLGILVLFGVAINASMIEEAKQKAIFMPDCLKEKKQYECDYMWRMMTKSDSHPVPMVMPMPIRTR